MASQSKYGSTLVSDTHVIGDAHEITIESISTVVTTTSVRF